MAGRRVETGGVLSRDAGDFRLVVQVVGGAARFLVLRHPRYMGHTPHAIIASGTEDEVRTAMVAAEEMAAKLMDVRGRGRRSAAPR
jgi:hypothetical protein